MSADANTAPNVLIVGASRGIGLELTQQYASSGAQVQATTRTPREPGALGAVADAMPGAVALHGLDVRHRGQIEALAKALPADSIDVFIHNAGIKDNGHTKDVVMQVNAQAPMRMTEALLAAEVLRRGARIVLMSSQMGARHGRRGSLGVYGDSKAALNDAFRERVDAWADRGVIAIVMHPGWVQTDMGGRGAPVSVTDSAHGIRRVVDSLQVTDHGKFLTWLGDEHPW